MRRLLFSVMMMFVTFGFCAPVYGAPYLVVYNVAFTIKGLDDVNWRRIPLKAYMVAEYEEMMGNIIDVNMILYGKDADANKAYTILNDQDSNDFIDVEYNTHGDYAHLSLQCDGPFDSTMMLMLGKLKSKNIGLDGAESVVCSFKGVGMINGGMLLDDDRQIIGTGSIRASMSAGITKAANRQHLTKDEVVEQLREFLESKGYKVFVHEP
jgi:hypothetical protein